jgi:hypothetical protein
MTLTDYLHDYNNCIDYCKTIYDNDSDMKTCINELMEENAPALVCVQEKECDIIQTDEFRELIISFIILLKIIYFSRFHYGNVYDVKLINAMGIISQHIDIEKFACVKFPGDTSYIMGYPKTLAEYLNIMKKIHNIYGQQYFMNLVSNDDYLSKYRDFCSDFQPWTSNLSVFVNVYSKKINLLPDGIPAIENKLGYELFISDYTQKEFNKLLETSNFDTYIIRYIRKKMGLLKRSLSSSSSRISSTSSTSSSSSSSRKKQTVRPRKKSVSRYRTVRKKIIRPSRIRTNVRRIVINNS